MSDIKLNSGDEQANDKSRYKWKWAYLYLLIVFLVVNIAFARAMGYIQDSSTLSHRHFWQASLNSLYMLCFFVALVVLVKRSAKRKGKKISRTLSVLLCILGGLIAIGAASNVAIWFSGR